MPPRFSRAVYDFESYLAAERNLSEGTRQGYVADIEQFVAHITERRGSLPRLDRVHSDDIRGYLEFLYEKRRLGPARLSRITVSLRRFFDFCVDRGLLPASPAAALETPKKVKRLPVFLVVEELRSLFSVPNRSTWQGCRNHAILVVLTFTGIRLAELVQLDTNDVDLALGQMKVMGKGAKERLVPLNSVVVDSLSKYLELRPSTPDSALFLSKSIKRISGRSVQKTVRKCALEAGVFRKGLSPHKLRHTFATLLHMKDVDILEIQSLLGHSSITSTQIYTHTHPGKLKSAVDKLSDI